ncbi:MAG TPA: alpha/beta fold hydrolase [Candidatus Kryptonia bacterium]
MILKTRDSSIAYETYGSNKTKAVTFIHGFPFSKSMWDEQAALLSGDHFVLTFDVRGHGGSEVGNGQYLIEFFVDDLIRLLDHLQIKKTILCGLSMGGYVALRAVDREPSRFSGLVLSDTKATPDTNAAKLNRVNQIRTILSGNKSQFAEEQVKALFAPESIENKKSEVKKIRTTILSTDENGLVGALIALASRMDMTENLGKISVPTLILVGEKDKVTPPSDAEFMRSRIPNSKLMVIHGAGHISNMENSPGFNSALVDFLSENNL